jgi:hypothetical protein
MKRHHITFMHLSQIQEYSTIFFVGSEFDYLGGPRVFTIYITNCMIAVEDNNTIEIDQLYRKKLCMIGKKMCNFLILLLCTLDQMH